MAASATLPSLLSAALGGLERACVDEGAGCDGIPSLDNWANLLRAVDDAGVDHRELPKMLRLSNRAVRSRVLSAVRNGWVEDLKSDLGKKTVRRTVLGSQVACRWKSLQGAAEERWRTQIGFNPTDKLRASLEEVVARMPLEHPHYPASYGVADARITGGNGQDWKAVPRQRGDTVSYLPLSALLSQALVAFAMKYEEKSPVALSLSTAVIRRVPPEGRPVYGIGYSVGISALDRHGFVQVSTVNGKEMVYLTSKGFAVSEAYEGWICEVETEWCKEFGTQVVTPLRRALEAIDNTRD